MAKGDCKLCGGTGWIVSRDEGVSEASRCECVAESAVSAWQSRAQIPSNYSNATLGSFVTQSNNPIASRGLSDAWVAVNSYARNFPRTQKQGLLLVGPPGVGKTHLAIGALKLLIERGHEAVFFDFQTLLDKIRSGYSAVLGTSSRDAYESALETEVLLMDDLGAHRTTDWVHDTVTAIVTHRCNNRKPLIATTNLDPEIEGSGFEKRSVQNYRDTLEQRIGERARSRLFEMCQVVSLGGIADYREKRLRN